MLAGLPIITSNIPSILEMLPKDACKFTSNSTDSELFFKKIDAIVAKDQLDENTDLEEWALHHFDPSDKFNQFKNELIR